LLYPKVLLCIQLTYFVCSGNHFQFSIISLGCEIGDEGAMHIANALKCNTTVEDIFLSDNKITVTGAKHLLSSLEMNFSLRTIDGPPLWSNPCEHHPIIKSLSIQLKINKDHTRRSNKVLQYCNTITDSWPHVQQQVQQHIPQELLVEVLLSSNTQLPLDVATNITQQFILQTLLKKFHYVACINNSDGLDVEMECDNTGVNEHDSSTDISNNNNNSDSDVT